MVSIKPLYATLFPNSARSIRIGGKVAEYSGNHSISAIANGVGGFELQATAIGHHDERLYGVGVMSPVVNKANPRAPDFRGSLEIPEGEGKWIVAAWWKQTTDKQTSYLSLTLTESPAADTLPSALKTVVKSPLEPSVKKGQPPPVKKSATTQLDLFLGRNVSPDNQGSRQSRDDILKNMLRRFIEHSEHANCAEDWARISFLAKEAREVLAIAA